MRFGWNVRESSLRIRGLAKVASLLFLALYVVIYLVQPFSDTWNTILSDAFLVIASSVTAAIATMIWMRYDPADIPRRIWRYFAIGLWLWAIAELTWGYLNVTLGEVPEGISDVFWISAYFLFAHALLNQYQILARPTRQELLSRVSIAALLFVAIYMFIYRLVVSSANAPHTLDAVINSFYPAADVVLSLIALWLVRTFSGGAFSRPWLGLLAFAFADLMYAWLEISGAYSWTVNQSNWLTTISDIAYLGAYLVLGLGVLSHWIFLKYGLRSPTEVR